MRWHRLPKRFRLSLKKQRVECLSKAPSAKERPCIGTARTHFHSRNCSLVRVCVLWPNASFLHPRQSTADFGLLLVGMPRPIGRSSQQMQFSRLAFLLIPCSAKRVRPLAEFFPSDSHCLTPILKLASTDIVNSKPNTIPRAVPWHTEQNVSHWTENSSGAWQRKRAGHSVAS